MRTRLIAAGLTTALAAGLLLVGAGAPARAGDLHVELSNTDTGMVHVEWDAAKGPGNTYTVQIATDRAIETHVRQFPVPAGQTWLDVPHADLVTPASGDYTFVKVRINRHGNGKNSGTPTAWIKPTPVVPPATGSRVEIATFNTRIWNAEDKKGHRRTPTSWSVRRSKIAQAVRATNPGVLLLQETSGAAKWRIAGKLWQFQDLAKRLPKKYKLSAKGLYTTPRKAVGSQGSRIIVDTSRYQVRRNGYIRPPAFTLPQIRWVPWVLLRDRRTAEEFYVASAHLQSGADKGSSRRLYNMRQRQTDFLHRQLSVLAATGRGVYLGGDLNSTSNTKPDNNVHRTLVADGWYDGFATTDVQGARFPTTNHFVFPVKPGAFRRDYLMSLGAPQGSYSYVNHVYNARSQFQSDHFMQSAVLPVQPGPYQPAAKIGRTKYKPSRR